MNRCHIYGIALLLLVSFDMHATAAQARGGSADNNMETRVAAQLNSYIKDLRSGVSSLHKFKKRVVGESGVIQNSAIYVVSRHDLMQALATTCSGKYSLAADNIALLISTFLVDGGMHTYNEIQEYQKNVAEYNCHILNSSTTSAQILDFPYKTVDGVQEIALKTAKDCAKTVATLALQDGAVWAIRTCGFNKCVKDLAKSKHLIKPIAFVLVRTAINSYVEAASNRNA